MRIALIISVLLMGTIAASSQDYHPSPSYYPIDMEIAPQWAPVSYTGLDYGSALPTWWERNKRPLAIIGYNLGTIALGAVGDGLRDDGYKDWGHAFRAAEIAALVGGPFLFRVKRSEAVWYLLDYGFLRLATFDAMYNATRGLPVLYNGTTSTYDDIMRQIPDHGKAWIKAWSFTLGVSIPIIELK